MPLYSDNGLTFSPQTNPASPAVKTLRAALMSRSWMLPHSGQTHSRTFSDILGTVCPQSEQRLLDNTNKLCSNCGMKTYIYALCCPITKKVKYVGKTTSLRRRFAEHKHNCLSDCSYENTHLMHWWKKLAKQGLEPSITILEEVDSATWKAAECRWISHFGRAALCNKHDGGIEPPSARGRKMSEATKLKLSEARKGKTFYGPSGVHPALGKPSPLRGRKLSADHIKKLSESKIAFNPTRGVKQTIGHVKARTEKLKKPVLLINTGEIFPSARAAAISLGLDSGAIARTCSGEYSHTHGYRFKHV